ncbi:bZIP transcription factor 11-like [Macadamia integrifolia]|uniref:bZIP transcription factor 11-like n=1 Tax=Macadamia integrifolia TaxID=60698 RepID=UPI001C4F3D88|nr:bZIP transcription factor 11-like [Macadamia integrifolia]
MASSSGTSSGGSTLLPNSGSEEDLQLVMDQRKKKRMLSNRESARRSRMRKQKHLDDLMAQVAQLRNENNQILTRINMTSHNYLAIEAENSVLRAQMGELNNSLQSLNQIIHCLNVNSNSFQTEDPLNGADCFMNPWNSSIYLNQPIMASADIFQY